MKVTKIRLLAGLLLSSAALFLAVSHSAAKTPKRVAILPFTMNADRDLGFLQEGIIDMLASRLAWKGEVEVLEKVLVKKKASQVKGALNREKAFMIGKDLQADYVIFGSLTVFGESVSIDAKILDVAKAEELITAFSQTKGMDEVIPTVNRFAADVNEKIMGRVISPTVTAAAGAPEGPKGPSGLVPAGESFQGKGAGHVQRFKTEIISMDVGDVDGDGKNELVFINRDTVLVYKWTKETFALFRSIKGGWGAHYVYVSLADLNKNGAAEIYVSSLGQSDVDSVVLEWQGGNFKTIAKGQPWFYRVVDIPGKGRTLVGQGRKTGGFYHGDVFFLKWEGSRLVSTDALALPKRGNVFNFLFADFGGGGKGSTVLLDESDYLKLFVRGGEEVWRSDGYFGGTVTHMATDDTTSELWKFFPSPIYLTDVDEDGEPEVMVCRNRAKTGGRFFDRVRNFSSGALHFMTWDKVGLSTKWTSQKQPGPIVGYRVADVDHDGLMELVIASVTREDHVMGKPRSQIVMYDLK